MVGKTKKREHIFPLFLIFGSLTNFIIYGVIHSHRFGMPEQLHSIFDGALEACLFIFFLLSLLYLIMTIKKADLRGISYSIIIIVFVFALNAVDIVPDQGPVRRHLCRFSLQELILMYQTCPLSNDTRKLKKEHWCDLIKDTIKYDNTFKCPSDKTGPCSYAMNENIPADANELPGDLVLLFESAPGWNQTGGPDDVVTDRHGENNPGANIAFADGHVEFVKAEDIPALRWTLEAQ